MSKATIDLRCDDPILYEKLIIKLNEIGWEVLKEDRSDAMEEERALLKYKEGI